MKKTWMIVIGLVALAAAVSVVQGQQALSGEYKIGVLEPLTGNLAAEGKRHLEGYEILRDLINEKFGGVRNAPRKRPETFDPFCT